MADWERVMKSLGWVVRSGEAEALGRPGGGWGRCGQGAMRSWVRSRAPGSAEGGQANNRLIHELKCRSPGVADPLLTSHLYFFLKQLALCFGQWMELSNQPQVNWLW